MGKILIFLAAYIFFCFISVIFRVLTMHPVSTVIYAVRDSFFYIVHKKYNICPTGKLIAYTALFGKGKTLSVVYYIVRLYNKYNNKYVWDKERKKFVTQKVHVISNVDLNIPFEKFVSLEQIINVAETYHEKDLANDTLTVTLVLGDEFSVQMNSRNFKTNIDPLFLNTLLTCRHHHILMVYDAQRFNHVDALLRQVTNYVVECNKCWRVMIWKFYDAYELENAATPSLVKPYLRKGWFIRDKHFNAYDTLACVGNLTKEIKNGGMLSEEEILALQCNPSGQANMDGVQKPSRSYVKVRKKMNK